MSIRNKILLIASCVMVFLVLVVLPLNLFLIIRNLSGLEIEEAKKALERSQATIQYQLQQLKKVVQDWAFWDDTYDYVKSRDPAYRESNLSSTTFINLDIDVFLLGDEEGRPVYAVQLEKGSENLLPPAPEFLRFLQPGFPPELPPAEKTGLSELILVGGDPYLLSVMPVLTSAAEGPPRGRLAMARRVDGYDIHWMEAITGAEMNIFPAESGSIPAGAEEAVGNLLEEGGSTFRTEGLDRIRGYALLDSWGEKPLVLEVSLQRDLFQAALDSTHLLFGSLFLSSLLLILGVYLAVNRVFVRPLERMTEVLQSGRPDQPLRSITKKRKDELATLAGAMDEAFEERRKSERRLRAILENSQDVIALFSETGEFLYLSPSALRILGYREDELLGRNVYDYIHPDDLPAARRLAESLIRNPETPASADLRFLRSDGTWINLEITGNAFLEDPHLKGILVTAHDVTERVRTQRVLERINDLLLGFGSDLMENMYSVLRACRDILGVDRALYLRRVKEGYAVLSTEDGEGGLSFLREGEESRLLARPEMAEGSPLVLNGIDEEMAQDSLLRGFSSAAGMPVRSRDQVVGYLLLLVRNPRDWEEEELRILGVLAKAMAVEEDLLSWEEGIKEFMDIASHELRHPITLMKGYALTLLNHFDRMDGATRRELLEVINQGADRLETLVSELLDLTRIERGRFTIRKKRVDPRRLLTRAVKEMQDRVPSRRFQLSAEEELQPRPMDEEKILQVLVILMDNAVKYTNGSAPVEVTARETEKGLEISVLDRGPGIPDDKRELVFHRFYQVEQVLHHSKPGLGLGLYIAREIVEGHGGKIWNEPREGGGTAFRFLLP